MSFLLVYQYGSRRENEAERFDTKTEAVTMGMHTHYRSRYLNIENESGFVILSEAQIRKRCELVQ